MDVVSQDMHHELNGGHIYINPSRITVRSQSNISKVASWKWKYLLIIFIVFFACISYYLQTHQGDFSDDDYDGNEDDSTTTNLSPSTLYSHRHKLLKSYKTDKNNYCASELEALGRLSSSRAATIKELQDRITQLEKHNHALTVSLERQRITTTGSTNDNKDSSFSKNQQQHDNNENEKQKAEEEKEEKEKERSSTSFSSPTHINKYDENGYYNPFPSSSSNPFLPIEPIYDNTTTLFKSLSSSSTSTSSSHLPNFFIVSHRRSGTHLTMDFLYNMYKGPYRLIKTNHVRPNSTLSCECMIWMSKIGHLIHPYRDIRDLILSMYYYEISYHPLVKNKTIDEFMDIRLDDIVKVWKSDEFTWFNQPLSAITHVNFNDLYDTSRYPQLVDKLAKSTGLTIKKPILKSRDKWKLASSPVKAKLGLGKDGWKKRLTQAQITRIEKAVHAVKVDVEQDELLVNCFQQHPTKADSSLKYAALSGHHRHFVLHDPSWQFVIGEDTDLPLRAPPSCSLFSFYSKVRVVLKKDKNS